MKLIFSLFALSVFSVAPCRADEKPSLRQNQRSLQGCAFGDFTLVRDEFVDWVAVPFPGILDMTNYETGNINIIANLVGSCDDIKCVQLSFADRSRTERFAPYTLYGDMPGGAMESGTPMGDNPEEILEARAYTNYECTENEISTSKTVNLIPEDTPREARIDSMPVIVQYIGTEGLTPSEQEVNEIRDLTCGAFNNFLSFGFLYRTDVFLVGDSLCTGELVYDPDGNGTLSLEFQVTAEFRKSDSDGSDILDRILDRRLPDMEELTSGLESLANGRPIGPGFIGLLGVIEGDLPETNAFSATTATSSG